MRRATEVLRSSTPHMIGRWAACLLATFMTVVGPAASAATATATVAGAPLASACSKPVYLTFDTGHMGVAPLIADVLKRHDVRVTFFLANERTQTGGASLDDEWAPWWRARAAEGHAFGSHLWNHDVWRGDVGEAFRVIPTAGNAAGRPRIMSGSGYCRELARPAARLVAMTGVPMSSIFRAPGGKTSPSLLRAATQCGWTHVAWADAGFLGDELSSEKFPNDRLLHRALTDIRSGDILLAHLGIWSRKDPWAPAVLEPLITGLKERGFCFRTLRDHPTLGQAARTAAPTSQQP